MHPNPTSGRVELSFNAEKAMQVEIGVADLGGRMRISNQFFQAVAGRNRLILNLTDKGLAPGMYIVTVRIGHQIVRKKVFYQPELKP